jgi:hypothetical protein
MGALIKQRQDQVDGLYKIIVVPQRQRLSICQRGLKFACHLFHAHGSPRLTKLLHTTDRPFI